MTTRKTLERLKQEMLMEKGHYLYSRVSQPVERHSDFGCSDVQRREIQNKAMASVCDQHIGLIDTLLAELTPESDYTGLVKAAKESISFLGTCELCNGTGFEHPNDACSQCGGTGQDVGGGIIHATSALEEALENLEGHDEKTTTT